MSPTPAALHIDIVSDVVCPWCFIGKRHLDAALAQVRAREPDLDVRVRWQPFELNPDLPADGIDRGEYLARKFGDRNAAATRYDRVRVAGERAGIAFAFERIERQPNTHDAHRLIAFAHSQHDDASPLVERLFEAYFCEGRSLVGAEALADLAAASGLGLTRDAVLAHLASGGSSQEVQEAERRAHAIGVSGVPFFIFERRLAVSGAQPADVLVQAIDEARSVAAAEPARASSAS